MDPSPDEFKELQTLLRLKKYEQPPADYGARFLKEFHRRQRWENARPKGFAALAQRFNDWTSTITVPKYAYAGTFGLFLMAALAINSLTVKPGSQNQMASLSPVISAETVSTPASLALNHPLDLSDLETQPQMTALPTVQNGDTRPRYILDTRPASYEVPFSF